MTPPTASIYKERVYKLTTYRLSDQLRDWRTAAGLLQGAAAAAIGVTQQTVSDWERGESRPDLRRASAIDAVYGLVEGTVLHAMAAREPLVASPSAGLTPDQRLDLLEEGQRLLEQGLAQVKDRLDRLGRSAGGPPADQGSQIAAQSSEPGPEPAL